MPIIVNETKRRLYLGRLEAILRLELAVKIEAHPVQLPKV